MTREKFVEQLRVVVDDFDAHYEARERRTGGRGLFFRNMSAVGWFERFVEFLQEDDPR